MKYETSMIGLYLRVWREANEKMSPARIAEYFTKIEDKTVPLRCRIQRRLTQVNSPADVHPEIDQSKFR